MCFHPSTRHSAHIDKGQLISLNRIIGSYRRFLNCNWKARFVITSHIKLRAPKSLLDNLPSCYGIPRTPPTESKTQKPWKFPVSNCEASFNWSFFHWITEAPRSSVVSTGRSSEKPWFSTFFKTLDSFITGSFDVGVIVSPTFDFPFSTFTPEIR